MFAYALSLAASVPYAETSQALYRTCLAQSAEELSTTINADDDYLATVADLSCAERRDRFVKDVEAEVRSGDTKLTENDVAEIVQEAHNVIVGWAEGVIFQARRQQVRN